MEDINMNRAKTAENQNKQPPDHAVFEDLWSSALDDSPPSSQTSSPVNNNQNFTNLHNHNNHHRRHKKRFKIRMQSDSSPAPKLNHAEQALVNQAIINHLSGSKKGRHGGSRGHHRAHHNAQNNAYSLNQQASGRSNAVPSTSTSSQSARKAPPACTQSRPDPEIASQETIAPKAASSSNSFPTSSVQNSPKAYPAPVPSSVTPQSHQAVANPHSASRDIPERPQHGLSTHSPQKPPSVPAVSLPPGYEYMNEEQKKLFMEFHQQQMRRNQIVSSPSQTNEPQQHQRVHQVPQKQAAPLHENSTRQSRPPHSVPNQRVQAPHHLQSSHQQNLETLQHSHEVAAASTTSSGYSSMSLVGPNEKGANPQQPHLSPSPKVPPQNVQPNFHQQHQVPNPAVQQRHQQQNIQQSLQKPSEQAQQQQQNNQQSLQNSREQAQQQNSRQLLQIEQAQQPHMSQQQGPGSVAATSVAEKRKLDAQGDDDVQTKKQKSTDAQANDETTEAEAPAGSTSYQVGGENNLVVHAPKDCTINIYQNRNQQNSNGNGNADNTGAIGSNHCNGCCGGSPQKSTNQKKHAIQWAGATETDSGAFSDGSASTASNVPVAMFRSMSKSIGRQWRFLARQLPMVEYELLESELKDLDACNGDDGDKSLAVLAKWWKQNPDNWDAEKMKRQLEDALRECKLVRLARTLDGAFKALSV